MNSNAVVWTQVKEILDNLFFSEPQIESLFGFVLPLISMACVT